MERQHNIMNIRQTLQQSVRPLLKTSSAVVKLTSLYLIFLICKIQIILSYGIVARSKIEIMYITAPATNLTFNCCSGNGSYYYSIEGRCKQFPQERFSRMLIKLLSHMQMYFIHKNMCNLKTLQCTDQVLKHFLALFSPFLRFLSKKNILSFHL